MKKRTNRNRTLVRNEVKLGERLFDERGRRSEVSGCFLGDNYDHVFASHILSKQAYPAFRLYAKNIVLMTFSEHQLWEFSHHKINSDIRWQWVFKLQQLLKQEYYKLSKSRI